MQPYADYEVNDGTEEAQEYFADIEKQLSALDAEMAALNKVGEKLSDIRPGDVLATATLSPEARGVYHHLLSEMGKGNKDVQKSARGAALLAARAPETGKTVQVAGKLNYGEWKKQYVDELRENAESDTINAGGDSLEQAKNRDHKIMITDIAIDKVPLVEVPGLSSAANESLRGFHKELLRDAKINNDSNEVAYAAPLDFSRKVVTYGKEDHVALQTNTELASLKKRIYAHELILAHNHPSTSSFSFADIVTFVFDPCIGLMTVVTNQGDVHVLQKGQVFEYNKIKELLDTLIEKYRLCEDGTEANQEAAAHEFLKTCRKVGVWYGRSK